MLFDTTLLTLYLSLVLAVAAVAGVFSLGVVARAVVVNRSTRLARRESMRTYYGRLAFHH